MQRQHVQHEDIAWRRVRILSPAGRQGRVDVASTNMTQRMAANGNLHPATLSQ